MIGEPRFWTDWHFLRTPVFQLLTRFTFSLLGQSSSTLLLITTSLGFCGLLVLGQILERWLERSTAYFIVFVVGCMPLLVAYQHTFLTETGSFFLITIIIASFLRCHDKNFSPSASFTSGVVVAIGYYFRPTLLVLSFIAPITFLLFYRPLSLRKSIQVGSYTLLLPYLLSLPWQYLGSKTGWEADQVLFGVINQAVLPVDSPLLAGVQDQYKQALLKSLVNGSLTSSGISDGEIYPLIGALRPQAAEHPTQFFLNVIREYPIRYLKGIIRGTMLLLGLPGIDSDNLIFEKNVFEHNGAVIFSGPPRLEPYMQAHFNQSGEKGIFATGLFSLQIVYDWLYRFGVAVLFCLMITSIRRKNPHFFIVAAVPFIFLLYHAAVLFSLDRMAVPVAPIIVSASLVFISVGFKVFTGRYVK